MWCCVTIDVRGGKELTAFATHIFLPRRALIDTHFHLSHLIHPPRATCGLIRDALCHAHKEALKARGRLEVDCLFNGELTLEGCLKVCRMWCMGKLLSLYGRESWIYISACTQVVAIKT